MSTHSKRLFFCLAVGVLLTVTSCARKAEAPRQPVLRTGEGRLAVDGGSMWYRVSGAGGGTPLVLLHGGPGFSSYYMKPLDALSADRQVIRYDQLGSGKSGRTTDKALFTIAHFVSQLDSLRASFGCPSWHLLGHSWGTILALEYYRVHPERVASMTFCSPVFDIPAFERHAKDLLTTLPDSVQQAVRRAEETGRYDDPAYQNAINTFYSLYVFRHPIAADLDSTFATANMDLYNYMQGPSEFTITGTLKSYDATAYLPQIRVPTLFTAGEFDEVGPDLTRGFAASVPGSRVAIFAGAAHITPWDAPEENVAVVRRFLSSADSLNAAHH